MIVLWILTAALLSFLCIFLHTVSTRGLDPKHPGKSMKRFWLLLITRLSLIGLFFWQLVQQGFVTILVCLLIFLAVYAGSLYYIIEKKPHWFQSEFKKEVPAWMP